MSMMEEIDLQLFIKCRLCLEESGIYQIVPAIRDQISFCFGINVEPFDGLPQLICKKCQLVLCEFSKTKSNFIEKQEDLKKRKPENNSTTIALDRSKNHGTSRRQYKNNYKVKANTKNKRKRLLSSSSEESNSNNSNHAAEDVRNTANKDDNTDWKANYQKTFTCTYCNITCSTRKSINCHQIIHKALKSKHADIFNKYCIVEMPKTDDKPNLTGTTNQVVYSKNKIIAKSTADYYVAYKYKGSLDNENFKCEEHDNADEYSDSSFKSNKKLRHRRIRSLPSRSSTETVVLEIENNTNGLKTDNDCISIDDSDSSNDKDETNKKRKASKKTNHIDTAEATKIISKLITISHNKYAKRHEVLDKSTLQQLNRKIISIGRQIINKRGFNTNRLMKYMEHLNLNIIWLARSPLSVTNNSNYFKIIPRTRYANEKSSNDFEGYKKKYDKRNIQNKEPEATFDQDIAEEEFEAESTEGRLDAVNCVGTAKMAQLSKVTQDVTVSPIEKSDGQAELHSVLILNENPAANPKQLKKLHNEAKKIKIASNSMPTLEVDPEEFSSEVMTDHENNLPVITLTRSLASSDTNENCNNGNAETCNAISNNENSKPEPLKTAPRIKVKSVSELMSKETLSRMTDPEAVHEHQYKLTPPQIVSKPVSSTQSTSDEYVILDTVELPNTKTNSPFNYFRMLLQVHNLSLLDTDAILTPDFHSLIRFKVRYNYGNKDPVVLCLSLLCLNNIFCIKIRDRYDENNLNLSKISAIWQWEILKIYKGDVVQKVLMNAQKTSPEVFTNTNRFICLLKSINYVPKVVSFT